MARFAVLLWLTILLMALGDCRPANTGVQQQNSGATGDGTSAEQQSKRQSSMREMMQSMMSGVVPPGVSPEALPAQTSEGAKLVTEYCAQCHNLPNPAMHSAREWPGIAGRMFRRAEMMSRMSGMMGGGGMMGGMAMMNVEAPTPKEQETIVAYLKKYSLRSVDAGALPDHRSEGAVLFAATCSRCHALPDPKGHTAAEWPALVTQMRGNMKSMGKPVMSGDDEHKIVAYLQGHAKH